MKKILSVLLAVSFLTVSFIPVSAVEDTMAATTTTTTAAEEKQVVVVRVRNEFDAPMKVMLGESASLTYIEPGNTAIVGTRKPGKFDFSIYDKDGDFITKVQRQVDLNKNDEAKTFVRFNKYNVPEAASKLDGGLSTGGKVAIGAGAIGAAALGTALIAKALGNKDSATDYYPPADATVTGNQVPPSQQINAGNGNAQVIAAVPNTGNTIGQAENLIANGANAFAVGGSPIKFLNSKYDQITLIIEGTDGKPIGSNWIVAKSTGFETAKPLMYSGQKITVGQGQTVKVVIPGGYTLSRYAFELDKDPIDGSYSWIIK